MSSKKSLSIWIAPLSNNIIEAATSINNKYKKNVIGFIISENQVSDKGYTGYSVDILHKKLNEESDISPFILRDHSSCEESILDKDLEWLNGIHIDPFKGGHTDPFAKTLETILYCWAKNPDVFFEVGTEEAIFHYNAVYLDGLLKYLKNNLPTQAFARIKYAVIQCGTKLKDGKNIGVTDLGSLKAMTEVCLNYGLIPKEHNGDYQSEYSIKEKATVSPNLSINIAPEVGFVESDTIYSMLNPRDKLVFFDLCRFNPNTKKWFSDDYDYRANQKTVVGSCGHYLYNNKEFNRIVSSYSVKEEVLRNLNSYLEQKISAINS